MKPKLEPNQILLTFEDKATVEFIKKTMHRRGLDLAVYICDNLDWDGMLPCIVAEDRGEPITADTCDGCDYADRCSDVRK